jgi:hypothetical protein
VLGSISGQCLLFAGLLRQSAKCQSVMPGRNILVARWFASVLQGIASAPLWDADTATVPGMVSASDFIQVLQQTCATVMPLFLLTQWAPVQLTCSRATEDRLRRHQHQHGSHLSFELAQVLQSLRTSVTSSGNPLSEAEMDRHTLKGLREGGPMQQQAFLGSQALRLLTAGHCGPGK